VLFPLHEAMKGHHSVSLRRDLERSQWFPSGQLDAMRAERLKEFLGYIGEKVPYYRQVFSEAGLDPRGIRTVADLPSLPTLTKAIIRENFRALKTEDSTPVRKYSTGGSSGEPLQFLIGRGRVDHDVAAKWRATRWWNVDIGDPEVVLWGSPIELGTQDRLRSLRDKALRTRLLPAFRMTDESMDSHLEAIGRVRPAMIFGYPSALALLCNHARSRSVELRKLGARVVFVTGETLYPSQRDAISSAFGAPVANGYGSRDAGFIAHECPHGSLHVSSESILLETVSESGMPVEPGEPGEIVVTHLDTRDFPFVRYRTGDVGVLGTESCSCGRGLHVLKEVSGRSTDFVLTPSGNRLHGLALIYEVRDRPGVRAFKFLQSEDLSIELSIAADSVFGTKEEREVQLRLLERLGPGSQLSIRRVDEVQPEGSGKYRYVESRARSAAAR